MGVKRRRDGEREGERDRERERERERERTVSSYKLTNHTSNKTAASSLQYYDLDYLPQTRF
jgi:hypothetical protein